MRNNFLPANLLQTAATLLSCSSSSIRENFSRFFICHILFKHLFQKPHYRHNFIWTLIDVLGILLVVVGFDWIMMFPTSIWCQRCAVVFGVKFRKYLDPNCIFRMTPIILYPIYTCILFNTNLGHLQKFLGRKISKWAEMSMPIIKNYVTQS